jgi:hypothetical protein
MIIKMIEMMEGEMIIGEENAVGERVIRMMIIIMITTGMMTIKMMVIEMVTGEVVVEEESVVGERMMRTMRTIKMVVIEAVTVEVIVGEESVVGERVIGTIMIKTTTGMIVGENLAEENAARIVG